MNEARQMVLEAAGQILRAESTPEKVMEVDHGGWPVALWDSLAETGMTTLGVPEEAGGAGGDLGDALALLQVTGQHAAPVPLAETILAGLVLAKAGRPVPEGPLTVAPVLPDDRIEFRPGAGAGGWTIHGRAGRVPWGRAVTGIIVVGEANGRPAAAIIDPQSCAITEGENLAGEPRDDVVFDGAAIVGGKVSPLEGFGSADLFKLGALARVMQMSGALRRVLDLSVTYATERVQFGRPLSKFQAVQQNLAAQAVEVAAAGAAAEAAAFAAERGDATFEIAAAKIRAGDAATQAAAIAHQVHGAIGFTQEHPLHVATRRLWSWRDEFGGDSYWAIQLGRLAAQAGADRLWQLIAAPPGRHLETVGVPVEVRGGGR